MNEPDLSQLKDYEYPDIAKRFYRETRGHKLEILHDDGLYRHLRMRNPETSGYWFDIITWPHNLVFRGDGETYAFSRLEDMFEFFRSGIYKDGSIHVNPSYWAEKLTSDRDCVHKYQPELFEKALEEQVQHMIEQEHVKPDQVERFREAIKDEILDSWEGGYQTADCAISTVNRFEFYNDEKNEYRSGHYADVTFEDPWEWISPCKDYEWWFLWALYGIVRSIQAYDIAKGVGPAQDTAQSAVTEVPVYNITSLGRDITRQGVVVG